MQLKYQIESIKSFKLEKKKSLGSPALVKKQSSGSEFKT